jgi:hypothetical protein
VLKFDINENGDGLNQKSLTDDGYNLYDGSIDSVLVSKVARLTNDGSTLGPGAYDVDKSSKTQAMSPRGAIKWSNSKSKRPDFFTRTYTEQGVGPGSYHLRAKTIDRSITNPTIPRQEYAARTFAGFKPNKKITNNGSIRDNFEQEEDEEEKLITPGPGGYLKPFHANLFGQSPIIHKHPQNFGSIVGRFREKPIGSSLGPGEYMS